MLWLHWQCVWDCCHAEKWCLSRWNCVGSEYDGIFITVHNSQFWWDHEDLWVICIPKPSENLHHVLLMAIDTHCCSSLLTSSLQIDNWKFQTWIHRYLRHVATDFQSSSCVIWQASALSPSSPSLRLAFSQPHFFWDHSWWGFGEQYIDELKGQMHLSGPVSGVCWILLKGRNFEILFFSCR